METRYARILVAAAEAMPADKYNYRPHRADELRRDPVHLINEATISLRQSRGHGTATRTAIDSTAGKDALVARLKESFAFCETAFAKLDDSNLSAPIQLFGPNPFSSRPR